MVPEGSRAHGGENAKGDADDQREGHGLQAGDERVGERGEEDVGDRRLLLDGGAEVALGEPADVVEVLRGEGFVEAILLLEHGFDLGWQVAVSRERASRRQLHDKEGERKDHEEDREVLQQA